ncbi:hypothetical protein N7509_009645 [Penicillium cosmopolitanum]|uniref:NACHT domain-containing protein n=1 Tax=Penicillium cosmopolitanum TaxID=1131564 RepID=A0A9W9VQ14_9EURO|nr:uncharacterized protein N7509_009645 [Penicillium cosmopolitanum]KAJ5387104.1 hypothetical protein N7509_009645 [Penicillium cosmopolitanum]
MTLAVSFGNQNTGVQLGGNSGNLTIQLQQPADEACLRDLRTTDPRDDRNRIERAKGGLLKDSFRWILSDEGFKQWQNSQDNRLLWIRGDPGKGKTMLLCGIIEELTSSVGDVSNISFFFCQASDVRINSATAVLRGLIYLLVEKQPSLISHVRSRYDKTGKALFEDKNAFYAVSDIFTQILKDPTLQTTYFIVDALDECTTDLNLLLGLITRESSSPKQVKWIISSRNWLEIEEQLETTTQTSPISLELNEASVSEAVEVFIRHKVEKLAKMKRYNQNIHETVNDYLSQNSQGTFLWVALVCEELSKISRLNTLERLEAFPPGLNDLYDRMIDYIRDSNEVDAEICLRVLAIISTMYRPPTLHELKGFLGLEEEDNGYDPEDVSEIIARCGSFLTIRDDVVRFVHQSAQDFLRLSKDVSPQGLEVEHHATFTRSLNLIFHNLKRNIYSVGSPGLSVEELRDLEPDPSPLVAVRYACIYWVDHFQDGVPGNSDDTSLDEGGILDRFLQESLLNWLEALGIMGTISSGIAGMLKLERLLQVIDTPGKPSPHMYILMPKSIYRAEEHHQPY